MDEEVYEYVQSRSIPLEDNFNSALRKILDIPDTQIEPRRRHRTSVALSTREFEVPILKALVVLGGKTTMSQLRDELSETMKDHFSEPDLRIYPNGSIRWYGTAVSTRKPLVQRGEVMPNSPRGIWEITPKGRARVEREMGTQSARPSPTPPQPPPPPF